MRESGGGDTTALLKAILQASNTGILLTDLDHESLACNGKFGQFFNVEPSVVVRSRVEELRRKVFPLLKDHAEWLRKLELIYADSSCIYEDDLVLMHQPELTLHRYTAPVSDASDRLIGRLWTFTDVTRERRAQRMSDVMHFVSSFHHEEPKKVYGRILKEVSEYYAGTTAILSLLEDNLLIFRGIEGAPSNGRQLARLMRGNTLRSSYCQFILRTSEPLIVQDASLDDRYADVPAAKLGLSRYMGVPIHDPSGTMVGTLCIVDDRTSHPLDEQDMRFLTMLAMRVSAELAREAHLSQRLEEHVNANIRQALELDQARGVLRAMNGAFGLLAKLDNTDAFIQAQLLAVRGVLGFTSVCLLLCEEDLCRGYAVVGSAAPTAVAIKRSSVVLDDDWTVGQNSSFNALLKTPHSVGVSISSGHREIGVFAFGSERPIDLADERIRLHLEALFDQVDLVVQVHLLHRELGHAHDELRSTHTELVQSEKLGIVGALAAATAHDIRNIMSTLDIELAASGRDPVEALAAVRHQSARFSVLAHRLLSYTKPSADARATIQLKDVLDSVSSLLDGHLRISKVILDVRLPQTCVVNAGAGQLEHVFINLFLNSMQAMPEGGTITVVGVQKTKWLHVSVSDDGRGIDARIAEELFKPFSTARANGFGLGLYSCQRIIEEHGGTIYVNSLPGEGTTFVIMLPTGPHQ